MEVPPYGGQERQHNPAKPPHTNTHDDHHNIINLKTSRPDFGLTFDDSRTADLITRPVIGIEPTPPHSTDSSAPLSPLPSDKSHAPLSPAFPDRHRGSASPASGRSQAPLSPIVHGKTHRLWPGECTEGSASPRDDAVASPLLLEVLSPVSPKKSITSAVCEGTDLSSSTSGVDICKDVGVTAAVAPNPCASVAVAATATTAASSIIVSTSTTTSSASVSSGIVSCKDSTPGNSAPTCELSTAGSVNTSDMGRTVDVATTSAMGCSVDPVFTTSLGCSTSAATTDSLGFTEQPASSAPSGCVAGMPTSTLASSPVDPLHSKAGRCSAPQPNDTPPPPQTILSLPSKLPPAAGIFDVSLLPALPDDCFRTLDRLVSTNPELLNEINSCPTGNNLNASDANSVNVGQLVSANTLLQTSTDVAVLNSLGAYPAGATGTMQPLTVPTVTPVVLPMTPEVEASTVLSSLSVRQLRLQKRQSQLLRRVRRLTAKGLASSVSAQLSQLIKHGKPMLMSDVEKISASCLAGADSTSSDPKNATSLCNMNSTSPRTPDASHLPPPRYDTAVLKGLSNSNLISYGREMETKATAESGRSQEGGVEEAVPSLPATLRYELDTIAGEVKAAARLHVEHDSDATESSSGGESCDELDSNFDSDYAFYSSKSL